MSSIPGSDVIMLKARARTVQVLAADIASGASCPVIHEIESVLSENDEWRWYAANPSDSHDSPIDDGHIRHSHIISIAWAVFTVALLAISSATISIGFMWWRERRSGPPSEHPSESSKTESQPSTLPQVWHVADATVVLACLLNELCFSWWLVVMQAAP